MKKNKRLVLVGPAGGGKSYISNVFKSAGYIEEVSYTSRPKRPNEKNGVDYHFVTNEEFTKMIHNSEMYEWTEHNGFYYGTCTEDFYNSDIFVWETDGIKQLSTWDRKTSTVIYVNTSVFVRIYRLRKRGWNWITIYKRIKADNKKFKNFKDFDVIIKSV